MEIFPIHDGRWSDDGVFEPTGEIIGYEARDGSGTVIGAGESIADAILMTLRASFLAKP